MIPINQASIDTQYKNLYNQVGGNVRVFNGAKYQRGHGLGNIFSGMLKAAMPMIKEGAKTLGKTALKAGVNIARDKMAGKSFKESFQDNLRLAGSELTNQAINNLRNSTKRKSSSPLPYKSKRRKTTRQTPKKLATRRRASLPKDIFS